MSWRERIALCVLTVMVALPAAGAFCAMTCLSASDAMTAHHGAAQRCDDATVVSSSAQIGARSEHDCRTHDGAVLSMATTPAARADVGLTAPPATNESIPSVVASLVCSRLRWHTRPLPDRLLRPRLRSFCAGTPEGERQSWGLVHFVRRLPRLTQDEITRMESLNPKTPAQFAEEEETRRFLQGETSTPSAKTSPEPKH